MNILELFCGTKSIGKAFEERGHSVFSIDLEAKFEPDMVADVNELDFSDILKEAFFKKGIDSFDVVWASPPCTHFSVANLGRHWTNGVPMTTDAIRSIGLVLKTIELINQLQPKYFFIKNPCGMLRKLPFMGQFHRKEVTYCQYGDNRRKPTDIWTNIPDWTPKKCSNGNLCHDSQPRGYQAKKTSAALKKGTQGMRSAKDRSIIPHNLCLEIAKLCEEDRSTDAQRRLT